MSLTAPERIDTRPEAAVTPPDDGLLVARARAGDLRAFEELYRIHAARVHAVCLRMTADETRASEAMQEAFVHAWKALSRFEGRSAFSTWLHRLAVNAVLDGQRRRTRRAEVALPDDEDGSAGSATSAARSRDAGLDLERAIRTLPEAVRVPFVLHDVEGYRHREIAEMTGAPEGTCRARLHQARRMLRERLRSWRKETG
jgi:RNA polymerase sigma-70 factor (ECF subfamily)